MKKEKVWINGRLVGTDGAKISVFDRGFLYGDAVFETMRSYRGIVFRIDDHLKRLSVGLKTVSIKQPYSVRRLKELVYRVLGANDLKDAYVRLTVTRGEGRFGINSMDDFTPNVIIAAKRFGEYPAGMYAKGISAMIVNVRQNEFSPLSSIKSTNFLDYILARLKARDRGRDEAILRNTKGYITEGATSNIFLVRKGILITPSVKSGILPGITRRIVIGLAKKAGLMVKERLVTPEELTAADEIFLTNSLIEILPVTRIGSGKAGDGRAGRVTKFLHGYYKDEVIKETAG